MHGDITGFKCQYGLFRRKVPFRTYQYCNVFTVKAIQSLLDAFAGMGTVFKAIRNETERFFASLRMTEGA